MNDGHAEQTASLSEDQHVGDMTIIAGTAPVEVTLRSVGILRWLTAVPVDAP